MQSIPNVSSEEELLKLRNEGKITEDEYKDLLSTMRKAPPSDTQEPAKKTDTAKSKRKLGRIAFALMLTGIILPGICFLAVDLLIATYEELEVK